jgi:hypothetical protein
MIDENVAIKLSLARTLAKLEAEQQILDMEIEKRQAKVDELTNFSLTNHRLLAVPNAIETKIVADISASNEATLSTSTATATENLIYNTLIEKKEELTAVVQGLAAINGLLSLEVTYHGRPTGEDGTAIIASYSDTLEATFILAPTTNALVDIQILSRDSAIYLPNMSIILSDAQMLPVPQDLRYALFALKAGMGVKAAIAKDLSELRRKCIVRQSPTSPLSITITLSNGLSIDVKVSECYSMLPGSVFCENIIGLGGWGADECESVKTAVNAKCFASILDVVDYLQTQAR